MKKINTIITTLLIIFFLSCSSEKEDESKYFDTDTNCNTLTRGTCCDVDGRILVYPSNFYTYTYKSNKSTSNIVWKGTGSIILIKGQGTEEAVFYFKKGFSKGTIEAMGLIGGDARCQSIIRISKL